MKISVRNSMVKFFIVVLFIHLFTGLLAAQPLKNIQNWASKQTQNLTALEVVNQINGVKADGDIAYGSEFVFDSFSTSEISDKTLETDRFVIAFHDGGNTEYGTSGAETKDLLQFTAAGHILGFKPDGVYVTSGSHMLKVTFPGANHVYPVASQPSSANTQVQPLDKVTYSNLWQGISLIYERTTTGIAKSSYLLETGAGVEQIRLRYNVPVQVDAAGKLVFNFETGKMSEAAPIAWQEIDGQRVPVAVTFRQLSEPEVGFALGEHNPAYPTIIDPTLQWNTFLGSVIIDESKGIALDGDGNVYVTGWSDATWGSPVNAHSGGRDVFVAKLNSSGELQWNTFMGSSNDDEGRAIAVYGSDNVYVTGFSEDEWGSPINSFEGDLDAFAAKLDGSGELQWNTFLGSGSSDEASGIAVDGSGNVYVIGESEDSWGSPINTHSGSDEAFAAKLNGSGVLQWNTFLGSAAWDEGRGIAVDGGGNVYVTGFSEGSWGSPVNAYTGGSEAFAAKLNGSGGLEWNTFLGSSDGDRGTGIAIDGSGNVYVTGFSEGTWGLPVNAHAGNFDAFTAKLNSSGALQWSTFLGASNDDEGRGITVDGSGNVYVTGWSDADWGLPVNAYTGDREAFTAKLNSSGGLEWNTFLGASNDDEGRGIAIAGSGNVYVTGWSDAAWGSPVNAHSGSNDAFAAQLNNSGTLQWSTFMGSSGEGNEGNGIAVDGSGNVYVTGLSDATWGSPVNAHSGNNDAFVAKLNSGGVLQWNTFLGSEASDEGRGIVVDGSGNVYVAGTSLATWGSPLNPYTGDREAFAAQLNSSGELEWSTFLGSEAYDDGNGIAVDGSGNVYVSGFSQDTWGSPVNPYAGLSDAFVAQLNNSGALQWNTFLGSSDNDNGTGIAVDGSGNVYVRGFSFATWGSPVNPYAGGQEAFAAKLNGSGALLWNTFMGSSSYDVSHGIAVDGSGNVYVSGESASTWGSPVNAHAGGDNDAFVAQLNNSGALLWNTFMGSSSSEDEDCRIAVDGSGNVYATGKSDATWGSPVNPFAGGQDAFIAQLNSSGALLWNTFMGSSDDDRGTGIAEDGSGNVYVTGTSDATWGSPVNSFGAEESDAFVAKLEPTSVTFTIGANAALNYQQTSPSPPQDNWPLGQFSLTGDATGATLHSVTITLGGTYDASDLGSYPFRLYANNSNDFGTATPIGSDVADPGPGNDVIFSSLSNDIPNGTRYYWVTADISGSASGDDNIFGTIDESGDLNIINGALNGSSSYGKLNAGGDVSLPVQLTSFTAHAGDGEVILKWVTESELNNDVFLIERCTDNKNFELLTEVKGQGNSNIRTKYSYADKAVFNGFTYFYRLSDKDNNGVITYHATINATPNKNDIELTNTGLKIEKYALHNNYPNPFNPETTIRFDVPTLNSELKDIKLTVYNSLGQLVTTLFNGQISGGQYELKWNAANQPSGIYFMYFQSEQFVKSKKVVLLP